MALRQIVVVAEDDPVAREVAGRWGTPPASGIVADGTPIRTVAPGVGLWRRPGPHIRDERIDRWLPAELVASRPTLLFPSIHRSDAGIPCLTVHPLGNPGEAAELGGRPATWNPTDARGMAHVLRRLADPAAALGLPATYEATHHGPELRLPSFFVEIGMPKGGDLPEGAARVLAGILAEALPRDSDDRIALAIGGGHYAPHFTELALMRRWAFGHIVSRHALERLTPASARAAWEASEGREGILFARARDAEHPAVAGLGPRLKEGLAPPRTGPPTGSPPDGPFP
ncbi:MAG: D-aminoacyl-tRNA deacylase [Thermoplasmata archaeon]